MGDNGSLILLSHESFTITSWLLGVLIAFQHLEKMKNEFDRSTIWDER